MKKKRRKKKYKQRAENHSAYTQVKIQRRTEHGGCKLLQKNIHGEWVDLGEFDTADEALDMLVDTVETMKLVGRICEREKFVSRYGD